jgi:hypothetical protein
MLSSPGDASREGPPVFEQPEMTYEKLMEYGNMLVMEQENVKRVQLAVLGLLLHIQLLLQLRLLFS